MEDVRDACGCRPSSPSSPSLSPSIQAVDTSFVCLSERDSFFFSPARIRATNVRMDGVNHDHVFPSNRTQFFSFPSCPSWNTSAVFLSSWRDARGHRATKSALRAHQPFARRASTADALPSRGRPQVAFFLDYREFHCLCLRGGGATTSRTHCCGGEGALAPDSVLGGTEQCNPVNPSVPRFVRFVHLFLRVRVRL